MLGLPQRQVNVQVNAEIRANVRANLAFDRFARAERFGLGRRSPGEGGYADMQVGTDADPCSGRYNDRDDDYYQHCEVRDSSMPAGPLNVDAGQNGGISVEAWDRNEIRVRAIVRANARGDGRAKEIANQVQIQSGSGRVYATGPDLERREWWSVSYRINVPRKNDLDLSAVNGGITIAGVSGNLRFDTTNGGVKLTDVGGRVNGETRNGGLNVTLAGTRWEGEGLDVETSNGGVTLAIPDGYNAELETRTVNGGLRIDFPITIQGELSGRRGISTIVDGAHAFAHFPYKASDLGCDYYGTSLHKWLLAPIGTGFLYVRRENIPALWPLTPAGAARAKDIRKFEEIGTHPAANHNAVAEALTFHEGISIERKAARLRYLRDRWARRLGGHPKFRIHTNLDPAHSCAIGNVQIAGVQTARLVPRLWERWRIIATPIVHREYEGVRVTPNVYTTLEEIDTFAAAMEQIAVKGLES